MPKINQYTDNSTIEDDDALLTYDPSNGGATKLTTFARIASWMSAKLAALAKKTAITSADQILMVNGSATARIDYNVLAKAIIEQYAGSTLAGSAQSVSSAFDLIKNNMYGMNASMLSKVPSGSDLDTYTTPGTFIVESKAVADTLTNGPKTDRGYKLVVENISGTGTVVQTAIVPTKPMTMYMRNGQVSGNVWSFGDWYLTNGMLGNGLGMQYNVFNITPAGVSINISSAFRGILLTVDTVVDNCAAYFVYSTSTGGISMKPIVAFGSNRITVNTETTNVITLKPVNANTLRTTLFALGGTINSVEVLSAE